MTEEKKLEFNRRYTWNDIIETYPDMYAFLAEPEFDEQDRLASGILIDVCDYEHREEVSQRILFDEKIKCAVFRTTPNNDDGLNLGVINVTF